ncbi:1-acyl-sn-glycerol-3-phosphate acyltransferase [Accumulibacter sp.]|uniref:1-acyl-sn-glycerol-3-phosphate acyltransferase n=1 Tax=Accumulibacter sp. TaxID=2053492 RepID=UPI0035B491F5
MLRSSQAHPRRNRPAAYLPFAGKSCKWGGVTAFSRMMWLGGIPVARETANNLVAASAAALKAADGPVQLIVPPEGTRSKTRQWKTGFYHIAVSAQVPIVLAYMDYEKKVSGLGEIFVPTGDVEADIAAIKAFYAPFKGRNASQYHAD